MRWFLLTAYCLLFPNVSHASEFYATRCDDDTPPTQCKMITMTSSMGAAVSMRAEFQRTDDGDLVTVSVSYRDDENYFPGAEELYGYVGILKHSFDRDDAAAANNIHSFQTLSRGTDNVFRCEMTANLPARTEGFGEVIDVVALAFTDSYPPDGDARWDSDYHNNHNIWVNLVQPL